jgi:hypothetical protein
MWVLLPVRKRYVSTGDTQPHLAQTKFSRQLLLSYIEMSSHLALALLMRGLQSKGYSQQHRSKNFKICLERCATACKMDGSRSTYTSPCEKFGLILKSLIHFKLLPVVWILTSIDPLLQLDILYLLASLIRYTEARRKASLNSPGTTNSIRTLQSFPS